jgi:TonB-linked SusC/RagA family outer membrane protein
MQLTAIGKTVSVYRRSQQLHNMYRMVKLTVILLLVGCLHLSANTFGQHITLSKKQATLAELFVDIHNQTGYYFYYSEELLQQASRVDIQVKQATLPTVLDICFRNQRLQYEIEKQVIIVTPKKKLETATTDTSNLPIRGRVVNEQEEPLTNVTIKVLPTGMMFMTDENGDFYIPQAIHNAVLEISSIGYLSKRVGITNEKYVLISLRRLDNKLDEVQIIAYGTSIQRYNTGNVAKVSSKEIELQPVANALSALQGRVAGLNIQQNTGVPGGGFSIQLRGQNSLRYDGNELLYIIDGVPYPGSSIASFYTSGVVGGGNPLSTISPADIESIEVLKDADATAIYGSRGANGVILITTKKGTPGKTNLAIDLYRGWGKVASKMDLLNTDQYMEMRHEAFRNDGVSPGRRAYDLRGVWDTTRYTDWQKTLVGGTANITNLELGISGGNKGTQFSLNSTYRKETTVFPGDFADQRGSVHLHINHRSLDEKFNASVIASYFDDKNNLILSDLMTKSLNLPPVAPALYNADGSLNWENSTWSNPVADLAQTYLGRTQNIHASTLLSYTLLPGLELKANLGFNRMSLEESNLLPASSFDPAYEMKGMATFSKSALQTWIVEPQVTYNKNIGAGKIDLLLGSTFQQTVKGGNTLQGSEYTSDIALSNPAAAGRLDVIETRDSRYRYLAAFGRLQYNLRSKYLLSLNGRRDGSSRFGPGNQFANFGSIGAGWIFSKEKWLEQALPFWSFGKIRASYGTTGSDQIGDYGYLELWNYSSYGYQESPGLEPANLANAAYKWEVNKKMEFGLELGFLEDRILLSGSYYNNRSGNQLVGYPLPVMTGFPSVQYNLDASLQNTGWEFEWSSVNIRKKHFSWTTSMNVAFPRNKLISFPNLEASSYARHYVVGASIFQRRTFQSLGVNPETGTYQFVDFDKNGQIGFPGDAENYTPIAVRTMGGISNTISWKGIQLDIFFQGVEQAGYNYFYGFSIPGVMTNQPTYVLSRWQQPGDVTDVQRYGQRFNTPPVQSFLDMQTNGDRVISDASYLRLKNLALAYQLPVKTVKPLHIQHAKIYVQAQNLLTWTNYKGLDPENMSFYSIPPLKVVTVGAKITF